jgi:hypothetical protein
MLLVDTHRRQIAAVRPEHIQKPFVPLARLRTLDDAREFLAGFERVDAMLQRVLADAATQDGSLVFFERSTSADLVTAAARAIAARSLQVVTLLAEKPTLQFDEAEPYADPFDAVVFPDQAFATTFLTALPTDCRTALDRALRHEAAASRMRNTTALIAGPEAIATLLASGALLLRPVDLDLRIFRLVWRRVSTPAGSAGKGTSAASPPPPPPMPRVRPAMPPPPPLPKPPPGPLSVLPSPPSFTSPQAATLIAAAGTGVPFCEECAKRAAGLA